MYHTKKASSIFFLIILFYCFMGTDFAQTSDEQLSGSRYSDPKGFFRVVPPAGWRVQEYPQDARGKVAFFGPKSGVELRSLAKVVDFNSVEELLSLCKDIENRLGINTNIQKITFLGRPAIRRNFTMQGIKLLAIDLIDNHVTYNLQYTAPEKIYEKYLPLVMTSMETYETIKTDVALEDADKHIVAQKLRLSQLFYDRGILRLALDYVREGLEVEPENLDLLKMKKQIETELHK